MSSMDDFFNRAQSLLDRLEKTALPKNQETDWKQIAYRWRSAKGLQAVPRPHRIPLSDLLCMDRQKSEIIRNTDQFVHRRSANNVLLWGSRGTGKSSLIKAILDQFAPQGLRLIEVEKHELIDLPEIVEQIHDRPERFILFCDDLSFEADDPNYKSLKAVLDGSISAPPENVLIYATSNRRHLLPEYMQENRDSQVVDGEIHLSESLEEKISLSERFGMWLSFYPFNQEQYLEIVAHWLQRLGFGELDDQTRSEALRWATQRGSRSGRVAHQFARDWSGRMARDE
jgi:predicted AAA+ superfamily ATPase